VFFHKVIILKEINLYSRKFSTDFSTKGSSFSTIKSYI